MTIDKVRFHKLPGDRVLVEGKTTPGAAVVVENKSLAPFAPTHTPDVFSHGKAGADGHFAVEVSAAREGDQLTVAAGGTAGVLSVRLKNIDAVDGREPVVRQQGLRLVADGAGAYRFDNVCKSTVVGEPGQKLAMDNARTHAREVFVLDGDGRLPPNARVSGEPGDMFRLATSDGAHNTDFQDSCGALMVPPAAGAGVVDPKRLAQMAGLELRALEGPLFKGPPAACTVKQGQIGDCWFVTAMDAIALRCPQVIEKMIEDHKDGTFTVTFQRYDHDSDRYLPERITVTNEVWVKPPSKTPVYGTMSTGEIWFPILEKAYAAWKGGFDGARSGYPFEGFEAVLGKEGRHFDLDVTSADALWQAMMKRDKGGEAMVAWSRIDSPQMSFANKGLVADHAYTVLGVEVKNGERLVKLRNPWGENPWAANRSPILKTESAGVLTMTLAVFQQHFLGLGVAPTP